MPETAEMPLQEVLQALSRTPVAQPQLRAALATTCARWFLLRGDSGEAVRHLGHALEMVPDLRPAMRLLYRIYLDRGDVRSAVMYLDQEIRATRHPREAAALYRERGQLVEDHFHDLAAAEQCYQAALKATPRDLAVLRSVERVSLARGDVFRLIANLESQLDVVQDEAAVAGILHDLAMLEARHRGDLGLAGDLLLAANGHVGGHLVLARDLFRVAEVAGDAELMLIALEAEADLRAPPHRAHALARASVTLREHRERKAALALLQAAAREGSHNVSIWRSLEEHAMALGRHDVALEACVGLLAAIGDDEEPAARAEVFYRLGKLALRLERGNEGLLALRKALRLAPGHPLVMEDASRHLDAGGMWAQHLELLKMEIAHAAGMTRAELSLAHLRAGQVMEERLGELEGARRAYEEAIAADPHGRPARDRLERVLYQLGDTAGLRRYYEAELGRANTAERRTFLLLVLGQLHAGDNDPETAIKFLVALLKQHPQHLPSLQLLARLLAKADRKKDLLRVTEQEVSLTQSPARRAKLLHRTGELSQQTGDPVRARKAFERALEVVDDHLPSIESLGALLREQGDDEALVTLLRKELLYANDRARQVAIQLEIATSLASKQGKPEQALVELRALLQRWPRHLPALHAAESLAAALGRPEAQLEFLEQHVAAVYGPRTRALLLHRAALVRVGLDDHEGAIRDLVRALELWPQLGVARAQLLQIYERLGRARELQAFAEAGLTSERGADDRRAMALQLAELSPQPVVALQYLGAVAEARPEDSITQLRLARAARLAGRSSREAGALSLALAELARDGSPTCPILLSLRYLAARAEEAAGNLEAADQGYAVVLDADPEHVLARRGRLRVRERQREAQNARSAEDFEAAAREAESGPAKAALLTVAAELHERRLDLRSALRKLEAAIKASPNYLPALHARARVLERMGTDNHIFDAIETLERLAEKIGTPRHEATVLCHAGTLALRIGELGEPNPRAWKLFAQALERDPSSTRAIRGLRRTREAHGAKGAPSLHRLLRARIDASKEQGELTAQELRELARLAGEVDGPASAADLLEHGLASLRQPFGLHADLAQAYARLDRWPDVVAALDAAIAHESSPERKAALHYYAGEACDRAGRLPAAVAHLLAAGRQGFHARHALTAADAIAQRIDALPERVEALSLLVDTSDGPERVRALRQLAELHRGPLGQPDRAVELMRELLLLRPTDLEVTSELRRLLVKLDRPDEAVAVLQAGIAHHRAWLRSAEAEGGLPAQPVAGLLRLFDALGERSGVYLAGRVLECMEPGLIPIERVPDAVVSEPWPLPRPQEGRSFDGIVGDLPYSGAIDLLREGVFYLSEIPIGAAPTLDLSPSRSLPSNHAVVIVVRTLAEAMGIPQPLVFVDDEADDAVFAYLTPAPCLVLGRLTVAAPGDPNARDAIGRALLRLSTGGEALHRYARPEQLAGLLVALTTGAGVPLDLDHAIDGPFVAAVRARLPDTEALHDLTDFALAFRESTERIDPALLQASLAMAEDRAGAVCAGDPRSALARVFGDGMPLARARMLVGYLLSDDHLALRRALGYQIEVPSPVRSAAQEARA